MTFKAILKKIKKLPIHTVSNYIYIYIYIFFYQNRFINECARRSFLNFRKDGREESFYEMKKNIRS